MVEPTLWDDDKFVALETTEKLDARLLFLLLITGPVRGRLPGMIHGSPGTLAEALRYEPAVVKPALDELIAADMAEYDPRVRLIRLPNAPRHNPCPNNRVLLSWWRLYADLPDSPLVIAHLGSLREAMALDQEPVRRAWDGTFGRALELSAGDGGDAAARAYVRRYRSVRLKDLTRENLATSVPQGDGIPYRSDQADLSGGSDPVKQKEVSLSGSGSGSGFGSGSGSGSGSDGIPYRQLTVPDTVSDTVPATRERDSLGVSDTVPDTVSHTVSETVSHTVNAAKVAQERGNNGEREDGGGEAEDQTTELEGGGSGEAGGGDRSNGGGRPVGGGAVREEPPTGME